MERFCALHLRTRGAGKWRQWLQLEGEGARPALEAKVGHGVVQETLVKPVGDGWESGWGGGRYKTAAAALGGSLSPSSAGLGGPFQPGACGIQPKCVMLSKKMSQ